jgi:hypothetical protein
MRGLQSQEALTLHDPCTPLGDPRPDARGAPRQGRCQGLTRKTDLRRNEVTHITRLSHHSVDSLGFARRHLALRCTGHDPFPMLARRRLPCERQFLLARWFDYCRRAPIPTVVAYAASIDSTDAALLTADESFGVPTSQTRPQVTRPRDVT